MSISRSRRLSRIMGVLALLTLCGWGCEDHVLMDEGFDLWCGDSLCAWELEEGAVRPTPTWHEDDLGVELVGTPVVLSQLSQEVPHCLRFEAVADVEEEADVTLELDFHDDGTVDLERTIGSSRWSPVRHRVALPDGIDRIRFRIRKRGTGRAALAQIEATDGETCAGPPIGE